MISGYFLIGLLFFMLPTSAMTVPFGAPVYSASITGDSELLPGNSTEVTITFRNTAQTTEQLEDSLNSEDSSPTVGYGVELILDPGSSPLQIPATPVTIPVLPPGVGIPVTFPVIIPENVTAGKYLLDLRIHSKYMQSTVSQGDSVYSTEKTKDETLPIPFSIKEVVRVRVDSVSSTNLSPGQDGEITTVLTNIGDYTASNATVTLSALQPGILNIYQGSYHLERSAPGETEIVHWRASVSDIIDATSIPARLIISYEDNNGILTSSAPVVIGIPIRTGPKFIQTYEVPTLIPGGSVTIRVTYSNTGDVPAYDASARIIPVSPVSSSQTGIRLGTIPPGGSAEAVYQIDLDQMALVKPYSVLSSMRYRGEGGLIALSDPMQIRLNTEPPGMVDLILTPLPLLIMIGILLTLGYLFLARSGRIAE